MNEPRDRIIVDAVSFGQVFRFQKILGAITGAMYPPRLMVALLMVLALIAAGETWDSFSGEPVYHPDGIVVDGQVKTETADWDAQRNTELRRIAENQKGYVARAFGLEVTEPLPGSLDVPRVRKGVISGFRQERSAAIERGDSPESIDAIEDEYQRHMAILASYEIKHPFAAIANQMTRSLSDVVTGVVNLSPALVFTALTDLFIRTPAAMWDRTPWFTIFYGLFALIVITAGGGALSRMAACETAGRERLRTADACSFAAQNWIKLLFAPLMPLILAGFLALVLTAAGVVFFLPYLDVVGGALYGVSLVIGFLIAFLLLTLGFSFIMLVPAVATENCSPADALQRAVAYLLSRPLHLLGYVIIGLVGLTIGYMVVGLLAAATMNITGATTGWLTSNSAPSVAGGFWMDNFVPLVGGIHDTTHEQIAAWFVGFWQGLIILLVASYVVSYIFSSTTTIYLLMRRVVDDQDMSEIWRPGLVPGTLAPVPEPIVHEAPPEPADPSGDVESAPADDDSAGGAEDDSDDEADEDSDETAPDDTSDDDDVAPPKKSKKKKKKT